MASPEPTVFVVDDDEAVRDSLRWLLESVDLAVVTCDSAAAFAEVYRRGRPGCLVTDVRMPGLSGLDLQQRLAEAGVDLPVIVVTGHGDISMAVRAMKAGAFDFIEKPYNDQVMVDVVQAAVAQSLRQGDRRGERLAIEARLAQLTPREREVLDRVVDGGSNKSIARDLAISEKTVETHRARVMEKMEAGSLADLVRMVLSVD
ncbi:MAG: response regulator transcription factor [Hyphomicrobiales bacterium]|nr:response regulator transcription factor [Hyphomicrobiales bacterium]MCP5370189.1 response regulator transcription factor [Hyphomicrobiales bacterium]